jgi:WD40 repeat protein
MIRSILIHTLIVFCCLFNWAKIMAQTEQPLPRREFAVPNAVVSTLSHDGHLLLVNSKNIINIFQTRTGLNIRQFSVHQSPVISLAFNPRKRVAISGDESGHIILWNVDDLSIVLKHEIPKEGIKSIRFSKDGRLFMVTTDNGNKIHLFDLIHLSAISKKEKLPAEVSAFDFEDNNNLAYLGHDDGTVTIRSLADSFKIVKKLKLHNARVTGLRTVKNGILTASSDKMVCVWDKEGRIVQSFPMSSPVHTMDLSTDQKTVVLALASGSTVVLDLATGVIKFDFWVKENIIESFFHPTEPLVVSLYEDNKARSWILK